jgi:hypothetical protein
VHRCGIIKSALILLRLFAYYSGVVRSLKFVTTHILFLPVECVLDLANILAIKLPSILTATFPYKQISVLYYADVVVAINGLTANR